MESITLTGAVLGGLGLFLLAIGMMTEGLKLAAGPALRRLLSHWSSTPLRGIFTGFLMTAVVQSSSAVMVASLGFVNAGLIRMRQALGIVYGANVGTTMTGWLVALIGFKLNIQAFALPMIGIGMALKLIKGQGRAASIGLALVGFGLFFVGIDVLKTTFEGLVQAFDIGKFTAEGAHGVLLFLLIGVVMTILTQSSSASIALTITAASSGMIGLYAAGAMVIGANVGTTSTAALAAIGATSNAKRVAAAQVVFNVGTALVALLMLPIMFLAIEKISGTLGRIPDPAISLALFHTLFNILGVFLIYPLNDRLASFLEGKFLSWEEKESHPRFLDNTIAGTPVLAVNALILESLAIAERLIGAFSKAIQPQAFELRAIENDAKVIHSLTSYVSTFIVKIEGATLTKDTTADLATLMRIEQYFLACILSTEHVAALLRKREALEPSALEYDTLSFFNQVHEFMQGGHQNLFGTPEHHNERFVQLQTEHDRIKANLILEATRSNISVAQMSETIDSLAEGLRITQQWYKAITRLRHLQARLNSANGNDLEPDSENP